MCPSLVLKRAEHCSGTTARTLALLLAAKRTNCSFGSTHFSRNFVLFVVVVAWSSNAAVFMRRYMSASLGRTFEFLCHDRQGNVFGYANNHLYNPSSRPVKRKSTSDAGATVPGASGSG